MMYKTETHLHVSEVSPCGKIRAEEMVRLYYEAGYKTIFVSDHFGSYYFSKLGNIAWEDKTATFLSGYYNAKEAGRKLKMNVLMSAEFEFPGTPNHYLAYGITKEFLDAYPDLCEKTIQEFAEIARKHNVLLIQAHPYRDGNCFPTPEFVEGMEIYNTNPRHENFSQQTKAYVESKGLYQICGSDAHQLQDIARCAVMSEYEIKTAEEFIALVKSGQAQLYVEDDVNDLSS